ncbi:MAG: hypothetical protein EOP16_02310 [Pseudonocardia sp.]|nr:MAG: hypothetical protein EOP16_02310 [Pseudonocardia sp.]
MGTVEGDRYHLAILDFHQKWEPFGGPSAVDIFVEFGLTSNQFHARYRVISRGKHGSHQRAVR